MIYEQLYQGIIWDPQTQQNIQDPTKYQLKHEILPEPKELTPDAHEWKTFFDCGYSPTIQIMAVCSEDHQWNIDWLKAALQIPEGKEWIPIDDNTTDVHARSVCGAVKDLHNVDPPTSLTAIFNAIVEILSQVESKLTAENGNDTSVANAKKGIVKACGIIEVILEEIDAELEKCRNAEVITNNLTDGTRDGKNGDRNGFPVVRILLLLPDEAFQHIAQFATDQYFFFKQFRFVLHDGKTRKDLLQQVAEKDKKIAELEKENAELKKENAELKKEKAEQDKEPVEKNEQHLVELTELADKILSVIEEQYRLRSVDPNKAHIPLKDAILAAIEVQHRLRSADPNKAHIPLKDAMLAAIEEQYRLRFDAIGEQRSLELPAKEELMGR